MMDEYSNLITDEKEQAYYSDFNRNYDTYLGYSRRALELSKNEEYEVSKSIANMSQDTYDVSQDAVVGMINLKTIDEISSISNNTVVDTINIISDIAKNTDVRSQTVVDATEGQIIAIETVVKEIKNLSNLENKLKIITTKFKI
ncbi:putative methyl-accepting chemotaxis sensory transducer [Clostridium butyricum]|nr:putative methyl-accepting chemotaxis sensory transducer [Clostridium butyricum]